MPTIQAYVKRIVISAAVGLVVTTQISPAHAQVRNTYNGAECVAIDPGQAGNLIHGRGVFARAPTSVVCPIVKAIFNSTAGVTAAVAASGGTRCRLESVDVFSTIATMSTSRTFPGTGFSGLDFSIPSSRRGGMQLVCDLPTNGRILNYLVRE